MQWWLPQLSPSPRVHGAWGELEVNTLAELEMARTMTSFHLVDVYPLPSGQQDADLG